MEQTIREVAYEETEHYTVMRDVFNHRDAMLWELRGSCLPHPFGVTFHHT